MSDLDKKRPRRGGGSDGGAGTAQLSPIVFLNVGGARRDVRRSLLLALQEASDNPLVDVLLQGPEHWSVVPTTKDEGVVRIYLDRNPKAFDDLLEYVEYGRVFLEELIHGNSPEKGMRLRRLRLEADYFTVGALSEDMDAVLYGEPASFRADGWFTLAGESTHNQAGDVSGWRWSNFSGSEEIASRPEGRSLAMCEVKTSGTYLVFFSVHTVAVTALPPGHGYQGESNDEFCTLGVLHENPTKSEDGHWTYPLARCGGFDYREDEDARQTQPILLTAAFAEPISLRKGNQIFSQHGTGVVSQPMHRIGDLTDMYSARWLKDNPECVNYLSLIQISGDSTTTYNVQRVKEPKAEPTIVKWIPGRNDFPSPPETSLVNASVDPDDATQLRFKKAGYYLVLGRVAGRLRKKCENEIGERPAVQLELRTRGGTPLLIAPHVISWPSGVEDEPYNEKMVEYGPIRDIIYAEKDSSISVKAVRGACLAQHGTVPVSFGKIPTQHLSIMRLGPATRIDRYQISINSGQLCFERALGGGEERLSIQVPLFKIEGSRGDIEDMALTAAGDFQCIIVGSLPSLAALNATLLLNEEGVIHSQLCKDSFSGAHSFQCVASLKENDTLGINTRGTADIGWDHSQNAGQLAFVVLE